MRAGFSSIVILLALSPVNIVASEPPLHERIDGLIRAKAPAQAISPLAGDGEFVRRAYLDFSGRIPTADETRRFLQNKAKHKRTKLIDQLLASSEYPTRMTELFDVMLMERLGEHAEWTRYLQASFEKNKPWNHMAREMLAASADAKGSAYWMSKRLENYGQNPVDYPALTRDIGRLFLGKDFRCAQCHDHLFIDEYKQVDFQGLFAFVQNVSLQRGKSPGVEQKPTTKKVEFSSVFVGVAKTIGPRIPGQKEIAIPKFKKGEEYLIKPDRRKRTPGVPRFNTLAKLAETLPVAENDDFNRNIVNRLWFVLMGRGLVHPLDLHHADNPPSHPKLLALLAKEFVAHKYDIKWLLREMALTETYQRSSQLPAGVKKIDPKTYRTALERRLSAEQLLRSVLLATGEKNVKDGATFKSMHKTFLQAFADPPREPVDEFSPSLKAALFVLNNKTVLSWFDAKPGNLVDRLNRIKDDTKVAEELYLHVLSRLPTDEETLEASRYLQKRKDRRAAALRNLIWALTASTEFCVNH